VPDAMFVNNKLTKISYLMTAHVEKIYDNSVWSKLRSLMVYYANKSIFCTLFVYPPFHSRHTKSNSFCEHSLDLFNKRITYLEDLGHDIQLHSHFYKENEKSIELSRLNIDRVLSQELYYLRNLGFQINGFVSGGWKVDELTLDILQSNGIEFDCSRFLKGNPFFWNVPINVDDVKNMHNGIIEIPTTDSVRSFLTFKNSESDYRRGYRMLYFHDYDLLKIRTFVLLMLLPFFKKGKWVLINELLNRKL
jgi:hypothetical protein